MRYNPEEASRFALAARQRVARLAEAERLYDDAGREFLKALRAARDGKVPWRLLATIYQDETGEHMTHAGLLKALRDLERRYEK